MEVRELEGPPSLTGLYVKALAGSVLPGGDELPSHVLVVPELDLDRERLTAYNRVCGFRLADTVPATYPHLFSFPLAMSLMTERSFPFSVLGMVHIENRIEQRWPLAVAERPRLRVWAEDLRPHPRGRQFDVLSQAELDGETVWAERTTYLRRGKSGNSGEKREGGGDRSGDEEPPREAAAVWEVGVDTARRYAAISGDRNPIHMSGPAARLFGMPGVVAHGMWMKARCLAAFEGRLPVEFAVEARFTAPLRLPAKARFAEAPAGPGWGFALWTEASERPHVVGAMGGRG
jgi:acyl dehydratase